MTIKKKKKASKGWSPVEWLCIGADVSMSSISLGGIAKTRDGKIRAGAITRRWTKDTDYFRRMVEAAKAHELVMELHEEMKVMANLDETRIAVEEAVAIGYLKRAQSAWVKQQLQISGSFLGGLLRWGYRAVYEIQAQQWQALLAHDLGITTSHTKWNNAEHLALPKGYPNVGKNVGKYRAQQWIEQFHPKWDGHWPDLIQDGKLGMISRPEGRSAQGMQSDDRYEALGIANWMRHEMKVEAGT